DIIFFWVARMMMMGSHFQENVPFKDVYIHALILDEHGQKMSKSKGNVIDPLGVVEKFGADALRFTLAAQAAQGRNIRLAESRIEGYRNFGTKLWNAARFCEMNECRRNPDFDPSAVEAPLSKWLLFEAHQCISAVTRDLEAYRFNDAASAIYRFTWNVFCDWHLELSKPILQGEETAEKAEIQAVTGWTLDCILTLLHPFMPFITEKLWGESTDRQAHLVVSEWPQLDALGDEAAARSVNWAIDLITAIRSARAEMNIPPGAKAPLLALNPTDTGKALLDTHRTAIETLARIENITYTDKTPKGAIQIISNGAEFALPLADLIDVDAEQARLTKELSKVVAEIGKIDKKLGNAQFVDRAPAAVVEEQKKRRDEYEEQQQKLEKAAERLQNI
ncbi:MAG: class I tRNA ligase family protein, partial [Pseudomonadota bacterium]